jgi:uncharacterized protein
MNWTISISRTIAATVFALTALGAAIAYGADDFPKNIMTGGPQGTYIKIGRDLAAAAADCGLNLEVQESAGSLENLVAVKKRLHTQFGIVQSDVLEYVRAYSEDDPDLKRSLFGVRIMFPLYNEEVHVLAKTDINSLADLSGRRVAIGKRDSGTFLTATLVLDIMRVNDAERMPIGSDAALPMLMSGEIDALFYVAGAPTALFEDPSIDGSKFHLVNITEPQLQATYNKATIPAGTYPFQTEEVEGIAVKAVLMTYDYTPSKSAYHAQSCKAASDIAAVLLANLDRFRAEGHPKWKDVDLTALPPGWQVGDCVKAGMAPDYKISCNAPEVPKSVAAGGDQEYLDLLKKRLGD